mmetsp:Transcript_2207/g.6580  ORF Transcript_2207/g.6580 Transcript_2207/m.6580 type:complete len:133 (-) Transcript_2207:839-1237(-)
MAPLPSDMMIKSESDHACDEHQHDKAEIRTRRSTMCFSLYNAAPASKVVDIISTCDQYSWNFQSVHDTVHPTFVCFIIPDLFRGLQSSAATFIATGGASLVRQICSFCVGLAAASAPFGWAAGRLVQVIRPA